ncbi:E3 ubiquitin-protein ligase sina [Zootermopsis nevadensis]|uniref:RING-type E3 ubiquitin transferase n=1 Tax=Zootermopsis nevadensis TaxID=136037 RepID=A0A067QIS6_ZOONE|nr:E3 ubiquitin-protein ligase sina [Zootermopsis nevadensis]
MEYLLPPIAMCGNGHNVCNACKSKLQDCPICKRKFTDVKNRSLENICRKVKLPCKYTKDGCTEAFSIDTISKHQSECPHGQYKCPFVIASLDCSWEGPIADMKDHIRSEHVETGDYRDVLGLHYARLPNFETSSAWCQALFAMNEVFFRMSEVIDGFLYSCVFYVGPKAKASKYNYRLTINNTDGRGCASMCHETSGFESDTKEVFRNGNCAVFHCEFAKTCVNEDNELVLEEEIFSSS